MMFKKESKQVPQEATKEDVLSRRTALKRIAAGLAGVGVVVVAGIAMPGRPGYAADVCEKNPYGDSAPKNRKPGRDSCDAEYGDAKS